MTVHLAEIGKQVGAAHMPAGCGFRLAPTSAPNRPKNFIMILLPPYSPELNPIENVWKYFRANQLSRRVC